MPVDYVVFSIASKISIEILCFDFLPFVFYDTIINCIPSPVMCHGSTAP
jgi:hypothetical protein